MKTRYKTIIGTALFGLTLPAQADFFKQPYVGLNLGYQKHKVNARHETAFRPTQLSLRKFNATSGGFHLGGEIFRDRSIYAALELSSDFIGKRKKVTTKTDANYPFNYSVRKGFSGDMAIKLGFAAFGVVPYVRAGIAGARWTQRYSTSNPAFKNPSPKKTFFKLGFTTGGGLQYKFTRNWSTSAEYKYSAYKQHRLQDGSGGHIVIKPRTHEGLLRLTYSFGGGTTIKD